MKRTPSLLLIGLFASPMAPAARGQEAIAAPTSPAPDFGVEILSDTHGADLRPYLKDVVGDLKGHWFSEAAAVRRSSFPADDATAVELTLAADGHLSAMRLEHPTGDGKTDQAAWNAVKATHFLPLPKAIKSSSLKLRIVFPTV